jgi:predicted naringenin-chalcone synthase
MSLMILGLGTATPPQRVTQDEAARVAALVSGTTPQQTALLSILYRQTQIASRHMVAGSRILEGALQSHRAHADAAPLSQQPIPGTAERMAVYQREALPLALTACRHALRQSNVKPADISHLVTVSCTGFAAPGVDLGLMKALHLDATVERTHVGFMGCHGAFNGLRAARAFVEADGRARVLLCAVELCSPHYYYPWRPDAAVANALFADGAGALVAGPPGASSPDGWHATANGSCVFPDSESAMTWTIGDHGFEMTLSKSVPQLIASHLRPWLERWLASHHLRIDQVASWAIHPGGPRILTSVEAALGLSPEQTRASREILRDFGNMSSATALFILERLRASNAPRPCVGLGFGPGLAAEAVLFR